jgi:hypothetical protein
LQILRNPTSQLALAYQLSKLQLLFSCKNQFNYTSLHLPKGKHRKKGLLAQLSFCSSEPTMRENILKIAKFP